MGFKLPNCVKEVFHLDRLEGLEELRIIELGFKFKLHRIEHSGFGIDVPEQELSFVLESTR